MDFIFEHFGKFFFVLEFVGALLIYRAPYFAGRGWLVLGFMAWGSGGLVRLLFEPLGYGYSDTLGTITQVLALVGYASILFAAYAWWKARAVKPGEKGAPAMEVESDQATSMIPRNDSNSISKAEAVRDQIYGYFTDACKQEGIAAEVFKSPPYSESVWVEVRVQIPLEEDLSLRAHATVTVQPREFHRFEQELTIVVNDSVKIKRYFSVIQFTREEAATICRYLAEKSEKLSLRPERCRIFPWQLWRPKNKIVRVKPSHRVSVYLMIVAMGLVLYALPLAGLLLLALAAVVWWLFERQKRVFSLSSGKPWQEPRLLLRMDSWQAVLRDLAVHASPVKEMLLRELSAGSGITSQEGVEGRDKFYVAEEDIWYPGVDGKVERRQIVVRLRRAIGFVHLYPYGNDLYVGWDAHINGGTWTEKMVGHGKERDSGRTVRAYGVTTAWHTPNEYDITDANFLLEWIHSIVTKTVQQALKEHQVDQEIDFTIVREARQGIAGTEKPGKKQQEKLRPRFRRVA